MSQTIKFWLDAAGRSVLLSDEETLILARKIQASEGQTRTKALNKLCVHNLKLVVRIVQQMLRKRNSIKWGSECTLDLLQQGYLGLRKAAEKYDPTRGFRFSTYAAPWVRQYIQRYLVSSESMIYIPENTMREIHYRLAHGDSPSGQKGTTGDESLITAGRRALRMYSTDIPLPTSSDGSFTVADTLTEENLVRESEDTRDAIGIIKNKMNQVGLDPVSQDLVLSFARTGSRRQAYGQSPFGKIRAKRVLDEALERLSVNS